MERLLSLRLMKNHHATIHIISHETTVTGGKVASCAAGADPGGGGGGGAPGMRPP